jgi:hypothetical protein
VWLENSLRRRAFLFRALLIETQKYRKERSVRMAIIRGYERLNPGACVRHGNGSAPLPDY